MPSSIRRCVYREEDVPRSGAPLELPPTKKEEDEPNFCCRGSEKKAPVDYFVLNLLDGDPPTAFETIISFLDPVTLGRINWVYTQIRALIRDEHWMALLDRVEVPALTPATDAVKAMPPLDRLKLWSKLAHFTGRVESLNDHHFYTNDEFRYRCGKQPNCGLPDLHTGVLDSPDIEPRRHHFFVRISYRKDDSCKTRFVSQSFVEDG